MLTRQRFSALDGFRGLVALCVCIHHTQRYWDISIPRPAITVDLFFLLGGFVVAHSYERRLLDGRLSFRDFVLVRLIRLYPLYLLSLFMISAPLLAAILLHHNRPDYIIREYLGASLLGVFMLPTRLSDIPEAFYPLNIVFWSLFWALVTNFMYAGLIRWLTDRVLVAVVVVTAAGLVLLVCLNQSISLGSMWGWLSMSGGFSRALFGMAMGVLLCRKYRTVPSWLLGGSGYLLPLAVIVCGVWTPTIGRWDWVLELLMVFVVFPWCVVRAVRGPQPDGSKVLQAVGIVSYPIYVLHMPVAHLLEIVTAKRMIQFAPWSGIAMVIILIGLAILADRRIDRPLRAWLTSRIFSRVPAALPAISQHT